MTTGLYWLFYGGNCERTYIGLTFYSFQTQRQKNTRRLSNTKYIYYLKLINTKTFSVSSVVVLEEISHGTWLRSLWNMAIFSIFYGNRGKWVWIYIYVGLRNVLYNIRIYHRLNLCHGMGRCTVACKIDLDRTDLYQQMQLNRSYVKQKILA